MAISLRNGLHFGSINGFARESNFRESSCSFRPFSKAVRLMNEFNFGTKRMKLKMQRSASIIWQLKCSSKNFTHIENPVEASQCIEWWKRVHENIGDGSVGTLVFRNSLTVVYFLIPKMHGRRRIFNWRKLRRIILTITRSLSLTIYEYFNHMKSCYEGNYMRDIGGDYWELREDNANVRWENKRLKADKKLLKNNLKETEFLFANLGDEYKKLKLKYRSLKGTSSVSASHSRKSASKKGVPGNSNPEDNFAEPFTPQMTPIPIDDSL